MAVGRPGDKPKCWSESLGKRGSDHDERFGKVIQLTLRLIREYEPVLIAIEAPIKKRIDNINKLSLLMGLQGAIRGAAYIKGVPQMVVSTQVIDKHFLGGRGVKGERKQAIFNRCKMLGWDVPDFDSSDAAALWDYACGTQSRSHSIMTTELFGAR